MESLVAEIVDGDGHIRERDEELYPYLASKYPLHNLRNYYLFPDLDGRRRAGGRRDQPYDAAGWQQFMDDARMARTVLYPTVALAFAGIQDSQWAIDLARAYNEFVAERYLRVSQRLLAVALLPVQDPQAAARELHRAVTALGFVGGLLPTPGLRIPYGDHAFDPLYQEAQSLGTALAVHGASKRDLGFDLFETSGAGPTSGGFVLAHPFAQMIQFTNMVCLGVFARFPGLKAVFLEAGCGWAPFIVERADRRMGGLLASTQVHNSPVYFHAELDEPASLANATAMIGEERLIYASDYPHVPREEILGDLQRFLADEAVSPLLKERLLCRNVKALYGLDSAPR